MPFSLRFVGMDVAVPVLNMLGLLSGIYVFIGSRRDVDLKVVRKVTAVMGISVVIGLFIKRSLSGSPHILYYILGTVVVMTAISGLIKSFRATTSAWENQNGNPRNNIKAQSGQDSPYMLFLLIASGIVHGIFICGGPLLISYMTKKVPEKSAFRATISTIWIFLNSIVFVSHIIQGEWTASVIKSGFISIPFLLLGMCIGGILCRKTSQRFFSILTYALLLIAGGTLFFK